MKAKLKDYIEIIFTDAPQTHRAHELKEEMYTDLCEKYDDLVAEGKTPAAAYHAVISGVGDIGELIEELKKEAGTRASEPVREKADEPRRARFYTPEEREIMRKYKNRCAVMSAVAVAMYILCWLPLVLLSVLIENSEVGSIVGLVVMFVMIAAATSLFIIQGMTKPEFMREKAKDDDDDDDDDDDTPRNKKGEKHPVYKAISGALWCLTVVVYLGVSFLSGAWHITWLIFLIATAIDNIIKACFELRS
ncbi:MAG: hypothetical protein J6D87_03200 [Clostridia bacterium]|nr:hypothetical protein [Clostridia bacterium]